jgi:hypothetical protein
MTRRLFLIDVKRRFINNTPYDVYKALGQLDPVGVECFDLRFHAEDDALRPADQVFLFLETAGTWMCFDWDEARFRQRLALLCGRYPRVTVIGPQAAALREACPELRFEAVDTLDFEPLLAPGYRPDEPLDLRWLEGAAHYTGEFYRDRRYQLKPTVSVYHSMSCPMECAFCFYAPQKRYKRLPFDRVADDLERMCARGYSHFYWMDPNFLLRVEDWQRLLAVKESWPELSYYCQLSPNFLDERTVERLRATGCCGAVVGIENADLIRYKGTIDAAHRGLERMIAAGMLPMLYFILDGRQDVLPLVERFRGIPFRYSVLNEAFAGDRSLPAIRGGFSRKRQLAEQLGETRKALLARPEHLENIAAAHRG